MTELNRTELSIDFSSIAEAYKATFRRNSTELDVEVKLSSVASTGNVTQCKNFGIAPVLRQA